MGERGCARRLGGWVCGDDGGGRSGGRWTRRMGQRRRYLTKEKSATCHGERGGGPSGRGGGGGAAAKTKYLGRFDTMPEEEQEAARREATLKPGHGGTWILREDPPSHYSGLQKSI